MRNRSHFRKRQKRRRFRGSWLGAAVLISCFLSTSPSFALLERPRSKRKQQQHESLSIPSSKTKAATRADHDFIQKSHRMSDQEHVAHHLFSNDTASNDFAHRLLEQTVQQQVSTTTTSHDHPLASLILCGIVTLALTSALLQPTVFVESLVTMASSVALLLSWLWFGRSTSFFKETVIMCITSIFQLTPRLARNSVMLQRIGPVALRTLKRMLLVEAWSRVWRIAGTSISKFFQQVSLEQTDYTTITITTTNNNNEEQQGLQWWMPAFVTGIHEFIDTSIRKGAYKAVTKTLEHNAQAAIVTTLESAMEMMETTVLPLVLLPWEGTFPFVRESSL
mmetsp:Transcript_10011/g.18202  ORF Transcript_10011/g.18202 Transcript_10011/m.18202 type:complete len:336 (+) Transcript_10011:71-1078(+)